MRYVFNPGYHAVVRPENVEFYLQVNPGTFEVHKCRGGWRPIDKKRWLGQLPVRAKEAK